MQNLSLGLLKFLGLAYWVTVTDTNQQRYCFGPFGSAHQAVSKQELCCRSLLEGRASSLGQIENIRISTEP